MMGSRRWRTAVVVAASGLALGAAATSPAQAAVDYDSRAIDRWSDSDPGGRALSWTLFPRGSSYADVHYSAYFEPSGELLYIRDNKSDGREAQVELRVFNTSGKLVDVDNFSCGYRCTENLGTPDGSGNIPEDYHVVMKLRAEGLSWHGPDFVYGVT
ncbi:hypothetical protein [Mumia sp. Pv 4-285]|uniref:hypothetical protein n=1 Tax=Mumia qirimensis TaxID=3234852 RepID=UPI00351D7436